MLAIKSIEVVEVDGDRLQFAQRQNIADVRVFDTNNKPHKMDISAAYEAIEGRRFFNDDGKEFCIGMSKQVQDAIGLPFEIFENMNRQRELDLNKIILLGAENIFLKKELGQHKEAGFWQRLKYLIKWDELNSPIVWPTMDEKSKVARAHLKNIIGE